MTRTKRSIASFSSLLLLQATTISVGLVSTPLLLQWLGDERFGAFRVAGDLCSYLLLLDMGIGGALCALLVQGIRHSDRDQVGTVLAIGIRAYLKVLLFMILGGIGLGLCIPQLTSVRGAIADELQLGFYINLIGLLLIPLNVFQVLIDANQRSYLKNIALMFQSFVTVGLLLLFAWLNLGIPGQFTALLIGNTFFSLWLTWESFRRIPNLLPLILHPPRKQALAIEQHLWQLNTPGLVLHLTSRISLFSDNVLVSFFLGSTAVVPFLITQRLTLMAQTQLQSITTSTWAALADLNDRGEQRSFNARLVDLTKLVMVMGLTIVIPIMAYNIHFVTRWIGAERFGGWAVTILAACNVLLRGIFYLWEWCFIGTGNQKTLVRLSIVGAVVNIVVSIVTTPIFGISGPLTGTFVSYMGLFSWWMPQLLKRTFGTNPDQLYNAIARPLLVGVPYSAIVVWISLHHTPSSWFELALEMLLVAVLYLVLAWWLVLESHDRAIWSHRILTFQPKQSLKQVIK